MFGRLLSVYLEILDPEEDPDEEEDGGAQDIDATRQAKSAVMKTSTRQVMMGAAFRATTFMGCLLGRVCDPCSSFALFLTVYIYISICESSPSRTSSKIVNSRVSRPLCMRAVDLLSVDLSRMCRR